MLATLFAFMGLGGAEVAIVGLLILGMVIWALIDVIKSEFTRPNNKFVWILVIVFMPILGSFLYLIIGRGQRATRY
ncbi:PLDc N-terminal domain-containing protein [Dyadobacter aurulentus]|uniref:PLDc N-terminal domain-containing protein n=1 Tax=Dyadobacter sp. UC 10 TaxID=2605428 RepID=UPI001CEC0C9A|nr:PLDc N-terminal domain-containing protein [Dyadobacter sp. UC 10]